MARSGWARHAPALGLCAVLGVSLAGGCTDASSPLNVIPLEPAELSVAAGPGQAGVVAERLAEPLAVEVRDRFGNAVPGVEVAWTVTAGGGSLPERSVTGNDGRASAAWTLGTRAGEQRAEARVGGVSTAVFTATAEPGQPALLTVQSGSGQAARIGGSLAEPLVVRLTDAYGNPASGVTVRWRVVEGGGTLSGTGSPSATSTTTDGAGVASVHWTLGAQPGLQTVEASVTNVAALEFSAAADPANLFIAGSYLTQSTQTYDGRVPLVAGRDAYLRVFVETDFSVAGVRPDVRARFYRNGALVETLTAAAPGSSVPTRGDEALLSHSWNLRVPGSLMRPGTSLLVDVDPSGAVIEGDESDNTFPRAGAPLPLDIRPLDDFRVRLVPVRHAGSGLTGDATEGNRDAWLEDAQAMFPFPGYDADVRAIYTTSVPDIGTAGNWSAIIQEMVALRTADGSDRYYYGVLRHVSPAYCGLGYLGYPVSIGTDVCGASTAAHEWGHNFNRRHTPCGNPAGIDAGYPYDNARLGAFGLDVARAALKHPDEYADLMSYCRPEWISDYTYEAVLAFREAEAARAAAGARDGVQPTLLVWGRIENGRPVLELAFLVETRPRLPAAPGPYTLDLLDGAGAPLYSLSFAGEELADLPGEHRHFSFAIPLSRVRLERLRGQRLAGGGATPALRSSSQATAAEANLSARRLTSGRAVVEWNEDAFPMALVRDPRTGDILSFARGGRVEVATDAGELDVRVSEGVRSLRSRVPVSR